MKVSILNPLTLFIGACLIVFSIMLWGESIDTMARLFFAPYLFDVSKGVGSELAQVFRWLTFVSHLIVIAFVVTISVVENNAAKRTLSVLGILFSSAHFILVALGYISTRLH